MITRSQHSERRDGESAVAAGHATYMHAGDARESSTRGGGEYAVARADAVTNDYCVGVLLDIMDTDGEAGCVRMPPTVLGGVANGHACTPSDWLRFGHEPCTRQDYKPTGHASI